MHFIRHFVPRKRFKWNQVSSIMRFVPRKRFRRNKSGNHTVPQVEDLRTYAGFHSPISRFFVHHVGRFPLPKVSRRHSPRQAGFVHHVGGKKRSGEVAPRSWRDAPRPVSGDIDIQLVTKQSVETWPKIGRVSTLLLKLYLIINVLQIHPWPRPAW